MALVELARLETRLEAEIVRGRLAADGVESYLFDVEMSWLGTALAPVRLMVDDSDEDAARRILENPA